MSILAVGEGWHNWHHTYPAKAPYSVIHSQGMGVLRCHPEAQSGCEHDFFSKYFLKFERWSGQTHFSDNYQSPDRHSVWSFLLYCRGLQKAGIQATLHIPGLFPPPNGAAALPLRLCRLGARRFVPGLPEKSPTRRWGNAAGQARGLRLVFCSEIISMEFPIDINVFATATPSCFHRRFCICWH